MPGLSQSVARGLHPREASTDLAELRNSSAGKVARMVKLTPAAPPSALDFTSVTPDGTTNSGGRATAGCLHPEAAKQQNTMRLRIRSLWSPNGWRLSGNGGVADGVRLQPRVRQPARSGHNVFTGARRNSKTGLTLGPRCPEFATKFTSCACRDVPFVARQRHHKSRHARCRAPLTSACPRYTLHHKVLRLIPSAREQRAD